MKRSHKSAYLLILPYLLFLSVFMLYPVLFSVWLTFHDWNIISPDIPFVGLENYQRLIGDELFFKSLWNTLRFILVNIPIQITLALLLAVALNQPIKGRGFFRGAYFLPVVTSGVVISFLWAWMLSTDDGIINELLGFFGIAPVPWLTSETWAIPSLAWVAAWKNLGYYVVIFLAGLQGIPKNLYEAARIDGAGSLQQFFRITLPMLNPAMLLVVILSTINGFQLFTEPFIMTGGGPANSSLSVVMYIYKNAFQNLDMGYAATIGLVLAFMILAASLIQKKFLERDTYY
ncbi:carbohydrate ABC transporter membrane protein 1 (CUT1 family) [Melghirimyces profundicolus]|uniref:Carbohydrate ABC transporter membrane protein 1 (CUT1 family) n=1 Tax=Melghirimyces profundicolus TaxID=1242148 RepID=A0A2T6BW56_9BACL|nr:sugar ABC transporter permease [Melghirimyces profundicolus]PTX60301.1 carbohydrate ABC transporter membrane protein 1 (CUT1 family) [Melghirimyces profundicolus]